MSNKLKFSISKLLKSIQIAQRKKNSEVSGSLTIYNMVANEKYKELVEQEMLVCEKKIKEETAKLRESILAEYGYYFAQIVDQYKNDKDAKKHYKYKRYSDGTRGVTTKGNTKKIGRPKKSVV